MSPGNPGRRHVDALLSVDAAQDRVVLRLQPGSSDDLTRGEVGMLCRLGLRGDTGEADHRAQ